jgi:hypothetical protein
MQVQSYHAASTQTRCPHGGVPASCSACSGGGGGGGGGIKARVPGLMNWSEAFAEWNAIQVAQARQKAHLKSLAAASQLRNLETYNHLSGQTPTQLFFQNLGQSLAKLLKGLTAPLLSTKTTGLDNEEEGADPAVHTLDRANRTPGAVLALVMNKLVAQLGEAQRMLEELMHHNMELFKRMLRRLAWRKSLLVAFTSAQSFLAQLKPKKLLRQALRSILSWLGLQKKLEEEDTEPISSLPKPIDSFY